MTFTKEKLSFFATFIEQNLGIVYSEINYFQLEMRLNDIMSFLGFNSPDEMYSSAVQGISGSFRELLLDAATNNETSFFRDPSAFQIILDQLIRPQIATFSSSVPYRIWSAACSNGQEPYSLAMMLSHEFGSLFPGCFEILATDFSTRVLNYAKLGRYSQLEVQRGLPIHYLLNFFSKIVGERGEDVWQLKHELQRPITFKQMNLLEKSPDSEKFNLILCRNMLIYQNVENKKYILSRITNCLHKGGYLVMGAAESLIGLSDDYDLVSFDRVVLYRKKD